MRSETMSSAGETRTSDAAANFTKIRSVTFVRPIGYVNFTSTSAGFLNRWLSGGWDGRKQYVTSSERVTRRFGVIAQDHLVPIHVLRVVSAIVVAIAAAAAAGKSKPSFDN